MEAVELSGTEPHAYDQFRRGVDIDTPTHQVAGFASPILMTMTTMELECQLAANGIYVEDPKGYETPEAKRSRPVLAIGACCCSSTAIPTSARFGVIPEWSILGFANKMRGRCDSTRPGLSCNALSARQLSVPAQPCVRCHEVSDFPQALPVQRLRFRCQAPTLVIRET